MRKSLKSKLIFSIIIGCFLPAIIGGVCLGSYMDVWLYKEHSQKTDRFLYQTYELIERSLFQRFSETTSYLANKQSIIESDGNIRNYIDYKEGDTPEAAAIEESITQLFSEVKANYKEINYIFLGLENGSYMEYPEFQTTTRYDPRERPWYQESIGNDSINTTEPYVSKVTKEMVISFTKRIQFASGEEGVIGFSVEIEELTNYISSIKLGGTGYLMVLDSKNNIVVSPENPEWLLKTPQELNLNFLQDLENTEDENIEATINGSEKIIRGFVSDKDNWKIVAIQPREEIIGKSEEIVKLTMLFYGFVIVGISIIVYFISSKIAKPILEISKVMNHIAEYDYTFNQMEDVQSYLKREDEIGIIATSLDNINTSYTELKDTVQLMDKEIKNIDIENEIPVRLTLSQESPFRHVAASFNMLLDRTQDYLYQLKAQIKEIQEQKEYIDFNNSHDSLTKLPNRRRFNNCLLEALDGKQMGAVIFFDLDDFRSINEIMGHVYGDKVLFSVANRLNEIVKEDVFVSRFSGDEFLILLYNQTDMEKIKKYVDELSHLFDEPIYVDGNRIDMNFSMGISTFPHDGVNPEQLISNADTALHEIKKAGKKGYRFFDMGIKEALLRKAQIESSLKKAIKEDGFKLLFQPQVDLKNGEISGYEALLRLKNSSISPGEFIPVAEETGLILAIGRIVTEKVIKQLAEWKDKGYPLKPVAINFSALQLYDFQYFDFLLGILASYSVETQYIEIEMTESIFIENKEMTLNFMEKLRKNNIKIAIDDFGTGYSSLSYLTFLPVDRIKLDRSINIRFLEISNIKVMDSLISLAHSLNLEVVAEGIETEEHFKRLKVGECDYIQGYYFSKPLEAETVEENYYTNYYEFHGKIDF